MKITKDLINKVIVIANGVSNGSREKKSGSLKMTPGFFPFVVNMILV